MAFPYVEILKKAYDLARHNWQLWAFGLFIGGTLGFNLGGFNWVIDPRQYHKIPQAQDYFHKVTAFMNDYPGAFNGLVVVIVLAAFLALVLSGLSRGAVIWATNRLVNPAEKKSGPKPTFFGALRESRKFLWRILGLQLTITICYGFLLLVLAGPVVYFFSIAAVGRAVTSLLLALLIFVPATFVFGFIHIYGPIFLVLYPLQIGAALQLSFSLLRAKIRESLVMAAFLVGVSLVFVLGVIFCIIVMSVPVALFALLLLKFQMIFGFYALFIGAIGLIMLFIMTTSAAFAVFQNMAWVIAVQEMVRALRSREQQEKVFVAEPAA